MSIEETLAGFGLEPVAGEGAREMMRLSLFDWAACGIAGVEEPLAAILRAKALGEGGAGQASLIGGGKVPMRAAALVNGAVSHALDYDDTHFAHIGHPSVAVIPAALAMAEVKGVGTEALIDAALVGAEASVRIGLWLGRDHYQIGFHQTATAGAFGAALAAGRIAGLGREALAQALGVATEALDHRGFESRAAFDAALQARIDAHSPALVVLAGFMRILTPGFVAHYAGRLVNIHPSLLPAFPGLHTHQRAIEAGCKFAGATVHLVTAELDHGPILAQAMASSKVLGLPSKNEDKRKAAT